MKIGVFGGTFDPVHIGHLTVADEVREQLDLAEVLFVPAGQPYLKTDIPVGKAEQRLQMVRLAIADKSYFGLSAMEIERDGPSYTVDTIAELKKRFDDRDELYFILGWDSLTELSKWHKPRWLIAMCRLVAVPRVGYAVSDLNFLEAKISGLLERLIILDKPELDISASVIRDRVARDLSIKHLVPEAIEKYIIEQGLYSAGNRCIKSP
ncbi:MAG: nicotinate-nucleotide adenylyltransferase [Dehalococcoidales bacterium]|jgi:nicotinate-nucleotide adenylyltransferase|nr:nicotinate-nucleotide adenylyltransferase [Dehalococcoidales bacterium]